MGLNNCKDRSGGNFVEAVVCQESEIQENGMKVCEFGRDQVLLVKQKGVISAVGTKCSHYGAPLINGALGDGRIRCPWHGACFNLKTGDIEDFPGLDSIPCYEVEIQSGGGVKVRANKRQLESSKRVKDMKTRDPKNDNVFVIIGGGPAGQVCAETLRQEGYTGRLVVVCAESVPPYDRIKLSKQLNWTIDKIQLRPDAFYKEHGIELMLGKEAVSVDTSKNLVTLDDNSTVTYNSLFIATGSVPRKPDTPGSDLENIFTLRNLSDAGRISKALTASSKVVIIGTSFIGMEMAAACISTCSEGSVTVIGRSDVPFSESLGKIVGSRIARLFTEKNVKLMTGVTVSEYEGDGTRVNNVALSDGSKIPADVVILGLGSTFATGFLKGSGITMNANGSVPVNEFLETNCLGVYAGGDIAEAPVYAANDQKKTIGHWGLAHYHGKIAALNMMSASRPLKAVPFFWTMLFGTSFRYAGHGSYDDTVIAGDVESLKFACYYCSGDRVVAICTVGKDPLAAKFAELIYNGGKLMKRDLAEDPFAWATIPIAATGKPQEATPATTEESAPAAAEETPASDTPSAN
ncbi:hypothetical protein O3M35_003685 [Rhynocoris fuscipes]|uniref:Rieske domain-containing protein n=1 Tax=Rhynocoris fuscipes TaxID=488301 RepID=A0AAW1CQS4_9HEMI